MVVGKDKGAKPAGKPGKPTEKSEKPVDESFEPIKVDARLANTAILMLESPEEEIIQKACESIFKFCEKSDKNKLIVHELGGTQKLFSLTNHDERTIQRNATMVFGLLSSQSDIRRYLRQNPHFIEKMISLLSPELDLLTNEYAAMWLRNMCEDYSTKTVIASSHGALTSLLNMLNANDPDAVYNALGTIDKLMADYQPRQMIRDLKGIEPILNLMKSDFPQIQELVFNCLTKISQNSENREILREIGGLDKLVDFLANQDNKDMHVNCLNVISNCLEDTQCLDLIQQSGGLTKILIFCQEASDENSNPLINAAAARAIARSARKAENRKILNEQYAEKMLIYLLLGDNDETKAAAAQALSVMAESFFCQESIRNYDGVETLIRLISSENSKIREYSSLALSNLTFKNSNNCRNILHCQGVEAIINLLKDEKDTTKAYACVCLANMSCDEVIREEVGQFIITHSLIPALNSTNTLTQSKACLTLAAYCLDSNIKNELKSSGVVPLIVQLIKSNDDEVRCNACWTITSCSFDHEIAMEFCKYGAIETLRDLNMSAQRKSNFSESALNKLLESNLSAKYAFINKLASTDTLEDGFYDMGPMRPSGKFFSLDELSINPVNDKRPIILVYSPEEKPITPIELKNDTINKIKSASKQSQATSSATIKSARDKESKEIKDVKGSKGKKQDLKKGNIEETIKHQLTTSSHVNSATDDYRHKEQLIQGMTLFKPNLDKDLRIYIDQIKENFQFQSPRQQSENLAIFVAEKMGGSIPKDEISNIGYELLINQTKIELKSNIIPIGKIRLGTFYHRALLYKVLADKLYLKVSLERGDYNRAWNTIALKEENSNQPPKFYIVDLMHEPGRLMALNSIDAIQYVKL